VPFTKREQEAATAHEPTAEEEEEQGGIRGMLRNLGGLGEQLSALAPQTSPRPRARPEGLGGSHAPKTSIRPKARPARDPNKGVKLEGADKKLEPVLQELLKLIPKDYRDRAAEHLPGILRQCKLSGITNPKQVAYLIATADHETKFGQQKYKRSQPLIEDRNAISKKGGRYKGTVHTNGKSVNAATADEAETQYWDKAYGGRLGNKKGTRDGRTYRGRGYVQLTGRVNYQKMTEHLREEGFTYELDGKVWGTEENPIDLVKHPDHVNRHPEVAARALVEGSAEGMFTGKALDDYITDDKADYKNARRVINGTDAATHIAKLAKRYEGPLVKHWPTVMAEDPRRVGPQ